MATNNNNNINTNNITKDADIPNNENKTSSSPSITIAATIATTEPTIPTSSTDTSVPDAAATPAMVSFAISKKNKSKVFSNKAPSIGSLQGFGTGKHDDDQDESSSTTIATLALHQMQERQQLGVQLVIPLLDQDQDKNQPLLAGRGKEKLGRGTGTGNVLMESREQDSHVVDNSNVEKRAIVVEQDENVETDKDLDQEAAEALLQDASHRMESHDVSTNTTMTNFSSRGSLIIPTTESHNSNDNNGNNVTSPIVKDDNELVKYQRDLQHRAQDLDVTSNAYISVPISEFGAAMLRGMGWKGEEDADSSTAAETSNKGKNVGGVVPRPPRLGLGATPLPPSMKHIKNGGGDMVVGGGRKRHWKGGAMLDLAHVQREEEQEERWRQHMLEKKKRDLQVTLQVGSIVRVKKEHGNENGQDEVCCHDERAKVIQTAGVPGLNRIMIQYEGNGKPIAVKKSSVVLVNRSDLEKNPFEEMVVQGGNESTTTTAVVKNNHKAGPRYETKREQEKRNDKQDNDNRHHHNRHHQGHDQSDQDNHRSSSKRRYEETVSSTSSRRDNHPHRDKNNLKRPYHDISSNDHYWLIPNIRVRVVTKKIAKGRQFREKGIVLDVLRQGREATIQMSNGDILERIPERYLETALPKAGGNVIVLTGTHKYDKGKLLERNSDKGRGVVQLYEDMNVVTLSLDDIAEYCAPLDDTLGDY